MRLQKLLEERGEEVELDMCEAIDDLIRDGEIKGEMRGIEKGTQNTLALINAMLADGRADDVPRLQTDPAFFAEMMAHYGIEGKE